MTDVTTRIENAKKVITGNESLLDMLDADGATELLNWGMDLAGRIAQSTDGMDDPAAELNLESRLKALRQFMRGVGNWAAGKYADSASRAQLSEKILEQLKTIHGSDSSLMAGDLENLMNLTDQGSPSASQLIVMIKESVERSGKTTP